jgi:hypothetical protein
LKCRSGGNARGWDCDSRDVFARFYADAAVRLAVSAAWKSGGSVKNRFGEGQSSRPVQGLCRLIGGPADSRGVPARTEAARVSCRREAGGRFGRGRGGAAACSIPRANRRFGGPAPAVSSGRGESGIASFGRRFRLANFLSIAGRSRATSRAAAGDTFLRGASSCSAIAGRGFFDLDRYGGRPGTRHAPTAFIAGKPILALDRPA